MGKWVRTFLAVALFCAPVMPAGTARAALLPADEAALLAAARPEAEVNWYISHYPTEAAEAIGRAFAARYPGLRVNTVRTTAQVGFQRLSQDIKAGVPTCDVFSSSDLGHYAWLKAQKRLRAFVPANAAEIEPAMRGIDPDGTYHVTTLNLLLITYNRDKVTEAELPKRWTDLLEPRWQGRIATGHPGFSGAVGVWAAVMHKLYGDDFFRRLAAAKPQIGRSIIDTVTMLNSGERAIAIGAAAETANAMARGNPLGMLYPADGTVLLVQPSGILDNAPHPHAAKLFMEFLTGAEAGQVLGGQQIMGVRAPLPPGVPPLSQATLLLPTPAEIEAGVPLVKERWRDLFGN